MNHMNLILPVLLLMLAVWALAKLKVFLWDLFDHMGQQTHVLNLILPICLAVGTVLLSCLVGVLIVFLTIFVSRAILG